MELPIVFFLVAGFAIMLIGVSKAGFAGGLGVLGVPLMSLYVSPQLALAIQMPILIVMDFANCWRYRNEWSRPVVMSLLPGALFGVLCGALLFQFVNVEMLKALIGAFALFITGRYIWLRFYPARMIEWRKPLIHIAGFVCGFAGITAHAGGPAIKGYLLSRNMEKSQFVGSNSMFFLFLNIVKGAAFAAMSLYSIQSLTISLMLVPFLVLGVWIGFRLHRVVSQDLFMKIAFTLLGLAGLRLLWEPTSMLF